jgi:Rrf2 family protein
MAVHALILLARHEDVCPSATLASQVNSHATFLRRVILNLVRAGIVEAREGRSGGYVLRRPPEKIPLSEVFRAVRATGVSACEGDEVECACNSGGGWETYFQEILSEGEERFVAVLEHYTIAELIEKASAFDQKP